jgi:hypothetical protein
MRISVLLIVITFALPVACNTCGGGDSNINYEISGQEIINSYVDIFEETTSSQLSFSIGYKNQIVAMMPQIKGTFGVAFACSPPPVSYVNNLSNISITSNKDLYDFASGEELISLFRRFYYQENEPVVFPIELYDYEIIELKMIGPIPDIQDHSFTIRSTTNDKGEFSSIVLISFQ